MAMSSDEEGQYRESGHGILEFSPEKAGLDITPANFDFRDDHSRRNVPGAFSSIAGEYFIINKYLIYSRYGITRTASVE